MPKSFRDLQIENLAPCAYCGEPATTKDHTTPKSLAFRRVTVPACRDCNGRLGSKYFKFLTQRHAFIARSLEDLMKRIRGRGGTPDSILLARYQWACCAAAGRDPRSEPTEGISETPEVREDLQQLSVTSDIRKIPTDQARAYKSRKFGTSLI